MSEKPLSVDEAAAFLNVKKSYLYNLVFYGKVISYKPGGKKLLFKQSDLEAYAYSNKCGGRQEAADEIMKNISSRKSRKVKTA